MQKRKFLAPLAISIAALLGGAVVPAAHAAIVPVVTLPEPAASQAANHFVLTRGTGGELLFAQHESHVSHTSHVSHSSHVSGS
jgi:hypothetical protein